MSNRNDINLRGAIPETPDMCRNAVLLAVSTYREERTMKRTYKVVLIAAIICILMCGAAFAIAQYYSVRDHVAHGNPSTTFEAAIVPVEKTINSHGLSMTFGDAVCDGKNLVFTMDIVPDTEAEPIYVYPTLSAVCNGKTIDIYHSGFDFSYGRGAIIPSLNSDEPMVSSNRGFEVELPEPIESGTIDWTYTLSLYKPTAKLVAVDYAPVWDEETVSSWPEYYRTMQANGEIGVFAGNSIGDYLNALIDEKNLTEAEKAVKSGMFELVDTIEFDFTTELSDEQNLVKETTHSFDGYTVAVKSITNSFMQVNYELEVVFDEAQPSEHNLIQSYVLADQDGNIMPWRNSTLSLAEDAKTCTVWGSVERITDAPLTKITFTLSNDPTTNIREENMPSFTIEIGK
ncbi:MAG: DUF4179 domain-containing protein [Clostridiales bacterium]|nr:DUF4179 domain-containing protein [Clostridiales bacterium]